MEIDHLLNVEQPVVQVVEMQQMLLKLPLVVQEIHLLYLPLKVFQVEQNYQLILLIMMVVWAVVEQQLQEKICKILLVRLFKHLMVEQEQQLQLQQVQLHIVVVEVVVDMLIVDQQLEDQVEQGEAERELLLLDQEPGS